MNYQTFEPNKELTQFVKCYWTLEGPKEDIIEKQTIVPDGCMEMIFHYGDLYKQYLEDGKCIVQPRCFVIGQLTRPLEIEPTGEIGIFSVRFSPDGFSPFSSFGIKEMENTAVTLERLFGEDGIELEKKILSSNHTVERIEFTEEFLLNRLIHTDTADRIIKSTIDTILTANGQLSIDVITKKLNLSRRNIERKFKTEIGLSPKQLSKTIRLQATLKMLLNNNLTSLTSAAYQGEYYDQAHFIKDFKEMTGYTPKEFYGDSFKMTSFFIAD